MQAPAVLRDDTRVRGAVAPERRLPDASLWHTLFGTPALSAVECESLTAAARLRTVLPGQAVFGHTDRARSLVALCAGDVALGHRTPDGCFHVERMVHAPGWLDQSSAWLGDTHAVDARAASVAVVVDLPRELLQSQIERHPGLAPRLIASLAGEVRQLSVHTHGLMHQDALARFAAWLLQRPRHGEGPGDKADEGAGDPAVVQLGERKRDIAAQLAITPETLSRLLGSLRRQGVIQVAGYTVTVRDRAALARIAGQ
jgi:CRP-like cAMP-binding protein